MTEQNEQPQSDYKSCWRKFFWRFIIPVVFLAMLWLIGGTIVAVNAPYPWIGRSLFILTLVFLSLSLMESYRRGWSDRDGEQQVLMP